MILVMLNYSTSTTSTASTAMLASRQ